MLLGLLHQHPLRSQEPGTAEMMLTQGLNKYLDAPDGLYPQYHNYKIQDTFVELIGTPSPPLPTGVVQVPVQVAPGRRIFLLGFRSDPTVRMALCVSVLSGV
jgi:hypothetical protein